MESDLQLATIRLLAVDVDGTLLTSDHRVIPEVRRAFADARAAGLTLVLASARSPQSLRNILLDLDHAGPCICFSGAWVGSIDPHCATTAADEQLTISRAAALAVAQTAVEAGLVPSWHTERRWIVGRMSSAIERESHITRQTPLVDADFLDADAPNKILLIGEHDRLVEIRGRLTRTGSRDFDTVFSHPTYLEILPKGADKAGALLALAARGGISRHEIAAVGDAQNDLGMITAAAFGVAMANASDEVRQAAKWTTCTNDEGGVAVLIQRILSAQN